jgi:hypothetical protein
VFATKRSSPPWLGSVASIGCIIDRFCDGLVLPIRLKGACDPQSRGQQTLGP